jgi:predicted transcriptional regulator
VKLDNGRGWRIYSLCAKKFAERGMQPLMPKAAHPNLTRREAQIMEILHRRRRATVEEIRAELPDASSPSSVRKLLDIMIDRRLLGREYDGPRFVYFPAATPGEASRSALKQLVRTFFNNSPGSAAAALLDMNSGPISDEEYERLSALLRRARDPGKGPRTEPGGKR